MDTVLLEIIYEGDHCIPCVYMLETIEEAISEFGESIRLEVVHLGKRKGGLRYVELSEKLGEPAPVPSIFIDGKMYYNVTPPVQELKDLLYRIITGKVE